MGSSLGDLSRRDNRKLEKLGAGARMGYPPMSASKLPIS